MSFYSTWMSEMGVGVNLFAHGPSCFDGIASAALAVAALGCAGVSPDSIEVCPIDYAETDWSRRELGERVVTVDLPFNPSAGLFVDHHPTSFGDGNETGARAC